MLIAALYPIRSKRTSTASGRAKSRRSRASVMLSPSAQHPLSTSIGHKLPDVAWFYPATNAPAYISPCPVGQSHGLGAGAVCVCILRACASASQRLSSVSLYSPAYFVSVLQLYHSLSVYRHPSVSHPPLLLVALPAFLSLDPTTLKEQLPKV